MILQLKEQLIQALKKEKKLSDSDIARALEAQKTKGGTLSENLVSLGLMTREELMLILSSVLTIPPISLSRYKVDQEIVRLIPQKVARHYGIIPISKMGGILVLATADPLNVLALDDIKALTGFSISPVITTDQEIKEAIEQYYGENVHQEIEKIVDDMHDATESRLIEDRESPDTISTADLLRMTQDAPVVKITNHILQQGVTLRASDVLIEPMKDISRVRYRVDGVLQEGKSPPRSLHCAIISRLKVMSDLNVAESRLPQDGRFKIRLTGREVDFRISVLPSSEGEKIALRILDKAQAMLDIDGLGFETESLEQLKKGASKPHGMVLVTGPTGCGKTTTLYSILKFVDDPTKNIVTVEDPVEYLLTGINQVTARFDLGLTFARALRSILRQDPDVIMIGEIRDFETADIAIKSALTGHLVLSTLHTTTASGAIVRLVNMGVEPFLITSSVILVAAQRLVRRVCPNCKKPYHLTKEVCAELTIKYEKEPLVAYKGEGCTSCLGSGYRGRTAIIEVLTLTPTIRRLILQGAQEHDIREAAHKEHMLSLRECGMKKALEGVTSIEEVLRVTVGDQDIELT